MRGAQTSPRKQVEPVESAATVVLAWKRGFRPAADLVLGRPYTFDAVEALLGKPVPEESRSEVRDRALREETTAAIDTVLAGSIAFRVITGTGSIDPKALHRAALLAKRIATGREVQKVVSDAVERVGDELRDEDVRLAVKKISDELNSNERIEAEQIEVLLRDRGRLGWSWWSNLATPAPLADRPSPSGRDLRRNFSGSISDAASLSGGGGAGNNTRQRPTALNASLRRRVEKSAFRIEYGAEPVCLGSVG